PTVVNVSWGTKDNLQLLNDANPVKEHMFHFTDLQPATEYFYAIDNRMGLTFSTPPLSKTGTLVTFAVASDFHYGGSDANSNERTQILRNISEDPNVNLFFMNGDIVDLGMVNSYWSEFFSDVSENMTKPVALVLGNHDTLIGGLYHFRNYFYPEEVKVESGNELYHRIDVGNVHFLVLEVLWGSEEFTSEQKQWLEAQLSSIPQEDWVIAISHCFYYSSGDIETGRVWSDHEDTTRLISPLFEKYNVDLVISGHNHHMELLEKDGVTYVLEGVAGGGVPGPRPIKSEYSKWLYGDSRGYLEVTVKHSEAQLFFKNVDGEVIQQFTVTQNTQ
ncbi:MAG: metallophosphoesterase, partial [Coprothermobacter proteolyticus]